MSPAATVVPAAAVEDEVVNRGVNAIAVTHSATSKEFLELSRGICDQSAKLRELEQQAESLSEELAKERSAGDMAQVAAG